MNVGDVITHKGEPRRIAAINGTKVTLEPVKMEEPETGASDATFWERTKASFADPDGQSKVAAWEQIADAPARETSEGVEIFRGGAWRPVDPEGFDAGDVADIVGDIPEFAGGALGGIAGATLGGGALTIPSAASGAAIGGLGGAAVRQAIGGAIGLPQTSMAQREARKDATVYSGAGELLPLAAPAVRATGRGIKNAIPAIGEAVTGIDRDVLGTLASERGARVMAKAGLGDRGAERYAQRMLDLLKTAKQAPGAAYRRELDFTTDQGMSFLQATVDTGFALEDAVNEAVRRKLLMPDGSMNPLRVKSQASAIQKFTEAIDAADQARTVDDLLSVRRQIDDMLQSKGAFEDLRGSNDVLESLRYLRGSLESAIETSADEIGMLPKYKAAKKAYADRKEIVDNLIALSGTDAKAAAKVRNLGSKAQARLRTQLQRMTELEPDLADELQELYDYNAALGLDRVLPAGLMDVGRGGAAIAGGLASQSPGKALGVAALYLGTRPRMIAPMVEAGGRNARALRGGLEAIGAVRPKLQVGGAPLDMANAVRSAAGGEVGDGLPLPEIRKAFDRLELPGKVAIDTAENTPGVSVTVDGDFFVNPSRFRNAQELREAVLDAAVTPQVAYDQLGQDWPRIVEFTKSRYGSDIAKATRAGIPEDQAVLDIVSKVTSKPSLSNSARHYVNVVRDSLRREGADLSADDVAYLLGRAARREFGLDASRGALGAKARVIVHGATSTSDIGAE